MMTNRARQTTQMTPLRRPPVRQATLVRSDISHTFDVFVTDIGVWWPVQPFSAGRERVVGVTVEPRLHGRVYETWADGTVVEWGRLLVWEPPRRIAMTWTSTPVTTEVELSFTALGPALTRVAVEHRGWEALSEAQLSEDCALPGGYASGGYATGWARILTQLAAAAEAGAPAFGPTEG
jgi:Activator of Hsp90 ATPase homolog 1-like protein